MKLARLCRQAYASRRRRRELDADPTELAESSVVSPLSVTVSCVDKATFVPNGRQTGSTLPATLADHAEIVQGFAVLDESLRGEV